MEKFFDSEEDKKVITGTYAVFNGKKYEACFVKSDRVTFQDEKLVEIYSKEPVEEDGLEKYGFGKYICYKKVVDIEELSEFYNIKEVCDYMGHTFPIVRKDGDTIRIFTQDPSFETKGFMKGQIYYKGSDANIIKILEYDNGIKEFYDYSNVLLFIYLIQEILYRYNGTNCSSYHLKASIL